ncbi:hypothetical protein GCM10017786_10020 [Amycolatopsis deserti]|uniref:Uncharacterized protein n=1 Tax=Amycolatopsis deserti TaxID=185696 RepID=A0ABQ3IFC6_9PSEU|nr:hypothetical protein [Amycolatopsis deserti]GHE81545.1 hypothetical protein GCM10017786_10020 [Amycolatopsis deserti]
MARPNSTVVVLAGSGSAQILAGLDGLANVRVASSGEPAALVGQTHAAYVVHDRDPLAGVADAWAGFFDRQAPPGTLEVAIEAAVADLRRGATLLPDYYLVLDPESLPATGKHWWLGVLAGAAPSRVVPAAPTVSAVREALSRLPAGRWWPDDVETWLRDLVRVVPDQVGLPRPAQA